jgi:hypothetical protein
MSRVNHYGLLVCLTAVCAVHASAAERIVLREEASDARIRSVSVELSVNGKLFPEPGPEKALKLSVDARFEYGERRLAGTGREAPSLRAIRHYDLAKATIEAGDQTSISTLRKSQRLVVAHGQLEGIELFSPSGPLTYGEQELLRIPGDSLAVLGLLPDSAVDEDESWKAADWVLPLFAGIEAVEKGELTCQLESVSATEARIRFGGDVKGATVGAASVVRIDGHWAYDRIQKIVSRMEWTQTEQRAIGAVSPGLDVVARSKMIRKIAERPLRLTDRDLADLPLEPNDANRLLMFDAPAWNVRFYHDRRWHLFHQTSDVALLRLLDKGGLIAQCNIKKIADAEPGKHLAREQFLADIERALGKNFEEIVQTETLKLKEGLFVERVVVVGSVLRKNTKNEPEPSPMQWIYYLVANSEGRQVSFVFSVDPAQVKELDNRDLSIVAGIEFLAPRALPTPGIKPAANSAPDK